MKGTYGLQTLLSVRVFLNEPCPVLRDRLERTVQISSRAPHLILPNRMVMVRNLLSRCLKAPLPSRF